MAKFTLCSAGHYYDSDIFPACPYCSTAPERLAEQESAMALKENTILHGRYCVQYPVGKGGYGFSYYTRDTLRGDLVMLKECFPAAVAGRDSDGLCVSVSGEKRGWFSECQEAMQGEALALQFVSEPRFRHFPKFRDFFYENDTTYLVTEYVSGQTLRQYMNDYGGALDAYEAKNLLFPVLDELEELHSRGIIHGDIAPDNLIIDRKDWAPGAVLIDFGAARFFKNKKQAPMLQLKPGFSPPEQYMQKGRVGPWTDCYAFAATFYYTLTGKVPPEAIRRSMEDGLIPPCSIGARISAEGEAALLQMLDLSPEKRDSGAELRRALLHVQPWDTSGSEYKCFSAEDFASTCLPPPVIESSFTAAYTAPSPVPMSTAATAPIAASKPINAASPTGLFSKLFRKKSSPGGAKSFPEPIGHTVPVESQESAPVVPLRTADVEFSALFPKQFIKGEYSILEMYIYEESQRRILDDALRASEGVLKESRGSVLRIEGESTVSIRLECADPAVKLEGNDESQVWRGKYLKFDFAVFLEESYPKRQLMFTATVLINQVPATRLRFTAECNTLREQKMELIREDILSAFVSYSSQDRSRVAAIIQGMKKARPEMDVFFDVDSLRSGMDWQRTLRSEIERRDILFLCWSLSAKESEWVDREWRYALEYKGLSFIEPIPIDPPNICPPPKELSSKHFNDRSLLYI